MSDTTAKIDRRCRYCATAVRTGSTFCPNCGESLDPPQSSAIPLIDRVSELFGSELDVGDELGRGGMAAVFAAFDPALQRRVAVKTLLPDFADDPVMVARFLREARTVAALHHPHVVSVYGVRAGTSTSAIVMQFVDGCSLEVVLRDRAPLAMPVAGLILAQVCQALQHAHDRGIVHRDVKPANVLIDHDGRAVVADFGIARREGAVPITDRGMILGTLAYMSPEQRSGESGAVGPASDQYALGVMAFELLGGRLPYEGTLTEMNRAHLSEPPPALRQLRSDIPALVETTVLRMLAKEPAERHPNLREAERVFRSLVAEERTATTVLASLSATHLSVAAAPAMRRAGATPVRARVEERPTNMPVPNTSAWKSRTAIGVGVVLIGVLIVVLITVLITVLVPSGGSTAADSARSASSQAPRVGTALDSRDNPLGARAGAASTAAVVGKPQGDRRAGTSAEKADSARVTAPIELPGAPPGAPPSASTAASTAASAAASTALGAPANTPAAVLSDARGVANAFVTMLNKRRWRELEQLGSIEGDATLRAEVIHLVRTALDFSAGFDRVASSPSLAGEGFETECILELEWRGGRRLAVVHLKALRRDGVWYLSAFGITPVE